MNKILFIVTGLCLILSACGNNDSQTTITESNVSEMSITESISTETTTEVKTEETKTEAAEETSDDIKFESDNNGDKDNSEFDPIDYRTDITYKSMCRKPDDYIDKKIKLHGWVISIVEDDNEKNNYLQIEDEIDYTSVIAYDQSIVDVRILEGDEVTIYGVFKGLQKYTSINGESRNDPYFVADKIEIENYVKNNDSPSGELRTGDYSVRRTEGDFIYNKSAKINFQDGEAYGCKIKVISEIVDRGKATFVADIFCWLKDEGNGKYSGIVEGKGSIIITAYESSIKIESFPDAGMEDAFAMVDDEYSYEKVENKNTAYSDTDYICAFSNSQYLREEDIAGMDKDTLALARNEIYARHGYIFQDPMISTYFNAQSWYQPKYSGEEFDSSVFNDYEMYNIGFISNYE